MQAKADTSERSRQTQSPWREYLSKAFAPTYLSNWILAAFALVAAGIALKTLNAIKEQARIARISLSATRTAANAARRAADAALESNVLTQQSNSITREATDLTRRSIDLTYRPKLIVRGFYAEDVRAASIARGGFEIVNVGDNVATLTQIAVAAAVFREISADSLRDPGPYGALTRQLQPGESIAWPFATSEPLEGRFQPVSMGIMQLYVFGSLKYIDALNIVRKTAFCRSLDLGHRRFGRLTPDEPDYEYSD